MVLRVIVGLVVLAGVGGAWAADFGFARLKGARGEALGAVTFRPFSSGRAAVVPLWVLVEPGDYSKPWLRAKHVAQALPKAVELLVGGEVVKVGADTDGNPALFVGAAGRPVNRADLQILSVLPGDVQRFRKEKGETRRLGASAIATYWKLLLEDLITVFVRFPLTRDAGLGEKLHLGTTRSGALLKRMIAEVGVLLRYEDRTLQKATVTQVKAKTLEVLDAMTQEQWGQLAELAFRVPPELELAGTGGTPGAPPRAVALPPPLPEDAEPSQPASAVPLYVEPDRTVWPGIGPSAPPETELQSSGESATHGPPEDSGDSSPNPRPRR